LTLAEIVADIERQARNYRTLVLPMDDAVRLLAVVKAAVDVEACLSEEIEARYGGMTVPQRRRMKVYLLLELHRKMPANAIEEKP
jgi:hypothetical protein